MRVVARQIMKYNQNIERIFKIAIRMCWITVSIG